MISNNYLTFDLTLFTDSAFSEVFPVLYYDLTGNKNYVDQTGKTFTMQLRKDLNSASADATINVRVYPSDSNMLEIYGDSTALDGVEAGTYYFSIMDTTNSGTDGEFVVASGNCLIIKNPTR